MTANLDDQWQAVYRLAAQGSEIVVAGVDIRPRGALPPGGLTTRLTRTLHPPLALRLFRDRLTEYLTPGSDAATFQAAFPGLFALLSLAAHLAPDVLVDDLPAYLDSGAVTPEAVAEGVSLLRAGELPHWKEFLAMRNEDPLPGWEAALDALGPSSRRPPPDRLRRLAQTAAFYVQARANNDQAPNRRVAEIQGRTPEKVRDDLRAARRAELLTEAPGRGRAGGRLTAKAREILEPE